MAALHPLLSPCCGGSGPPSTIGKPSDAALWWMTVIYWPDFSNFAYPSPIWRPQWEGSPQAIRFIFGTWKLEWLGYNLAMDAWWSTQSSGHNTSTWQTQHYWNTAFNEYPSDQQTQYGSHTKPSPRGMPNLIGPITECGSRIGVGYTKYTFRIHEHRTTWHWQCNTNPAKAAQRIRSIYADLVVAQIPAMKGICISRQQSFLSKFHDWTLCLWIRSINPAAIISKHSTLSRLFWHKNEQSTARKDSSSR